MKSFLKKSTLLVFAVSCFAIVSQAATVVTITDVFGHNEGSNYAGTITDMINGSGMNGYGVDGNVGWPTGEGLPGTWSATSTNYGAEWQSKALLSGATNSKIAWTVFDLGSVTADLDELYIWHIRENSGRVATNFNVYVASAPTVTVSHGPTNSTTTDYDFSSGGWTTIATGVTGTHLGTSLIDLGLNDARYVALEVITNGGDGSRTGFAEVGITAADPIPEPSVALLSGLGVLMLLRRRKH